MSIFFPSFDITGIRPSRWYAAPRDWERITEDFEYEDGIKDFNETADDAPRHWEYGHTGLSYEQAVQFDDFYDLVRLTQPFYFKDKYGNLWDNVFIESYTRTHEQHKSWSISLLFRLVGYGSTIIDSTAPSVPLDLAQIDAGLDSVTMEWSASTDNVAVTGYQLRVDGGSPIDVGNVLTYEIPGLDPGTTYDIEVRAYDAIGNLSAWSAVVEATTADVEFLVDDDSEPLEDDDSELIYDGV